MKVLQEGNANWEVELFCTAKGHGETGCKAKLLVSENDFFIKTYSDLQMEILQKEHMYAAFECPICRQITEVSLADIPFHPRLRIIGRYNSKDE